MKLVIQESYKPYRSEVESFVANFDSQGAQYGKADRNTIKLFNLVEKIINVKSFKVPNLINKIAYRFFRKSKAQRSYEYANKLTEFGIGTPEPIAFVEDTSVLFFKQSYYVSEHLEYDLTFRELTRDLEYPNHETILRAFTRFTYLLHEKGVNFLDHSPGNTLIKKVGYEYQFYLVDLNRMEFKPMDFATRIKNFSRLTKHKSIVKTMSDEYAKCSGEDFEIIYSKMWQLTQEFQKKFHNKRRLKKKLKFWKK